MNDPRLDQTPRPHAGDDAPGGPTAEKPALDSATDPRDEPTPTRRVLLLDYYYTKILSFSFLAHGFAVLALLITPLSPSGLSENLFRNANRFTQIILHRDQAKPEPKRTFELSGAKGGGRHKDEEGRFGRLDKPTRDAAPSVKGAPSVDPNKRERDRQIALQSGLLRQLSGSGQMAASNVFGPGGLGTGINNALGGLRGPGFGDAGGAGGLGTRGNGPGGGGLSLGIGGLGPGPGRGNEGLGDVDLGGPGHDPLGPQGVYTIKTQGCLSQAVVGRVLSRNHNRARYCYERELTRNPNLAGKVTTYFVIGPTGRVRSARVAASTMNDARVEACLLRMLSQLVFPPCAGGGTAHVTYPWIFSSGGGR